MPCKILQRFGGSKPSWYSRIGSRENPPESLVIWRTCVKSRVSSMFPLRHSVLSWILVGLPLSSHYNPNITPTGTDEAPPFRTSFWWCFGPARVHQIDPGRAAVSHVYITETNLSKYQGESLREKKMLLRVRQPWSWCCLSRRYSMPSGQDCLFLEHLSGSYRLSRQIHGPKMITPPAHLRSCSWIQLDTFQIPMHTWVPWTHELVSTYIDGYIYIYHIYIYHIYIV